MGEELAFKIQYLQNLASNASSSSNRFWVFSSHKEQLLSLWNSWNVYWDSSSFHTSNRTHTYNPWMLDKWSDPCITPESIWLFLLCLIFISARPDRKWSIAAKSGMKLPNAQSRLHFKRLYMALGVMNYFPPYNALPADETLLDFC